jgi:2-methylcitrate dehydratase PrpD
MACVVSAYTSSVDALLKLTSRTGTKFEDIEAITVKTYQAAINVLSLSEKAETVHQSKFSMGFVLAITAKSGHAAITDFTEEALKDKELREFQKRVAMVLDEKIEDLFPEKWTGSIEVLTRSGGRLFEAVDSVKGDPEQTLTRYGVGYTSNFDFLPVANGDSRDEIEAKARDLALYGGIEDMDHLRRTMQRIWSLEDETNMLGFAFE